MLYKKLSNEFKDRFVTVKKIENLNNLILLLHNIDANMMKISKQSQLRVKPNASNFPIIKLPFNSYNLTSTKPSNAVGVAIISPVLSTTIKTHPSPINVFIMIRRGAILQKEKDRQNNLDLYCYCGKSRYIAIDHRNSSLSVTKKQAADTLTSNLMALVPYKPLSVEEKETFLG